MDDDDGLRAALDRLVERGVLDQEQAGAVLAEAAVPAHPGPPGVRRLLGEIAGYLGACFVIGATLLFLGDRWEELGRGGRVAILAAMAAILFAAGWAVRQLRRGPADEVRRRLASTLLTGSAAATSAAVYVALVPDSQVEYVEQPWNRASFAAAVTALAVVVAGYLLARSALGLLGVAAAAYAVVATGLDLLDLIDPVPLGFVTVALGAGWATLAWRRLVPERRAALAIAVAFGLFGAQFPVMDGGDVAENLGYLLTALVAAACFTAYARVREWILVAGGVVGATLVVPEFLYDVTGGSLGAAGVLLVAGVTLLAGSLIGLRIRRPSPSPPAEAAP